MTGTMPGLYIHIPFCLARCRYCAFYSTVGRAGTMRGYVDGVVEEFARQPAIDIETVYLGGGTPTALPPPFLLRLLDEVLTRTGPLEEVTVECNPATVDPMLLEELRRAGVTRLSIGVQSFDDDILRFLGRPHSADEARRTAADARSVGFSSVGLDLIYAVPGQSIDAWEHTLREAVALEPDHVSCYALSFEEGTELDAARRRGEVTPTDESADRAMYDLAVARLNASGLARYEVSNFARPGHRCLHNLGVWQGGEYLGLGPAASSFVGGEHRTNVADLDDYIARVARGDSPVADRFRPDADERAGELAVLALRTTDGLDLERFRRRTGREARETFPIAIARHVVSGMLRDEGDRLALAEDAFAVADGILADFSLPD